MPNAIGLPAYLSARSADVTVAVCGRLLASNEDALVDASPLQFADPFGLAMLGATFQMMQAADRAVQVCGLNPGMAGYLSRMDVFEGVELVDCGQPPNHRHNRADNLVELTHIDSREKVDEAAYRLAHALVGRFPGVDLDEKPDEMTGYTAFDRLVEPIQYALSELLENALTHARMHGFGHASVWVASQYYPRSGMIRLGVVDNGCGILASLRGHPKLKRERHHDAILTALQPRISCNRDLRLNMDSVNQGVGLTTTCRIAEHAGGRLIIVSGDAMHDTAGKSGDLADHAYWQGTAIALEFKRDRLPDIRYRELLPAYEAQQWPGLRFE